MANRIHKISLQHLRHYNYNYLSNCTLAYLNFLHYNDGNLWANKQKRENAKGMYRRAIQKYSSFNVIFDVVLCFYTELYYYHCSQNLSMQLSVVIGSKFACQARSSFGFIVFVVFTSIDLIEFHLHAADIYERYRRCAP